MSAVVAVGFRPMTADDLALVRAWLEAPHVTPWWDLATDYEEIRQAVHGEVAVEPWILVVDGHDAGYFQVYEIGYDAPYAAACATVGVGTDTAGMDYLIGTPERIGGGVGTSAIGRFVADVVFGRAAWPAVCAGPDPANGASIRVLEKNGFRYAGTIATECGPEHLMVLARDARGAGSASVERPAEHGE